MCVHCGDCVAACPTGALSWNDAHNRVQFDPAICAECDTCIHTCTHDSSPRTREMTPEEVMAVVRHQIPFIRGISVSGGECMLYPDFLTELFTLAREAGLGTLIDSNGTISFRDQDDLLSVSDGVMLDIKAFDDAAHIRITDATNAVVLDNARYLASIGKLYEVRCVIVPELYDCKKSVTRIAEFLAPYLEVQDIHIKVIAYRPIGVREEYSHYAVPTQELLEHLAGIFTEHGFAHVVVI